MMGSSILESHTTKVVVVHFLTERQHIFLADLVINEDCKLISNERHGRIIYTFLGYGHIPIHFKRTV
jgi:hypothetical protein